MKVMAEVRNGRRTKEGMDSQDKTSVLLCLRTYLVVWEELHRLYFRDRRLPEEVEMEDLHPLEIRKVIKEVTVSLSSNGKWRTIRISTGKNI